MKIMISALACILIFCGCNSIAPSEIQAGTEAIPGPSKDTVPYPFVASYSSNITVPGNPENAHLVLRVWKLFETKQIDSMGIFFADSVRYQSAEGTSFYGPKADLLKIARKELEALDSLRFDIFAWLSGHVNDKNEDWVDIWSAERVYPKKGKADTSWIQENWQIKKGKIVYFNQYKAKVAK